MAKNAWTRSHYYKSHFQAMLLTCNQIHPSIKQKHQYIQQEASNIIAISSDNVNTVSSDNSNTVSTQNIIATSTENINAASADEVDILTSTNIAATSSDNMISISSIDITTPTPIKRKQASPAAQEETQGIPKKKTRTLNAPEYIRDTFGYTLKDLRLLGEALDTTGIYRPQSNQSLALIGDSILQLTIYRDWYPSRQLKGMQPASMHLHLGIHS